MAFDLDNEELASTKKIHPTRYYSKKQEKKIAKDVKGRMQPNSGATLFSKGDIQTPDWLFEAKTCEKIQQSFAIKQEWLDKLKEESFAMNKEFCSLVFNFGNNTNYYVLDENTFKQLLILLEERK